jgi:pimeloyl-ACP methyl ester carboxylesterase
MTAYPGQLIVQLLLGLMAAGVSAEALYLLHRLRRRRVVAPAPEPGAVSEAVAERRDRRRRLAALAIPLGMLAWVFGGKYIVMPFFPGHSADEHKSAPASMSAVRGASGAELAIRQFGPSEGSSQQPTIVLTHGWGADHRDWSYVIDELPRDFRVVAWDLPGLGASTAPPGDDFSVATMAADLDSVVSSVKGPVILVGHSIGGILNIEYARRFPAKLGRDVVGIVQVNTTFTNPVETKKNPERSRQLQKPLFEPLLHVVSVASPAMRVLGWLAYRSGLAHIQLASQSFAGAETWDQLDEMARYAYRSSPGVIARGVLGMLHWDGSAVLPTIGVPTLIIAGAQDITTLPAASDRMARDIPSAERLTIDGAAHMGPVEQHERYAEAIASFAPRRLQWNAATPEK